MLHYLAELRQTVESLLPDHEGSISEKIRIAKAIVEDERLLAQKSILSAIDPDARVSVGRAVRSPFSAIKNTLP